jgi:mannose PTS system EIID component
MTTLPRSVRTGMFLRSFTIQGSWNYESLIGAGFAFTLLPALRFLYGPGSERLEEAVARHIELFNSHPYLATVAVGAVSQLEAEGADPVVIQRFKSALRGSLGSLGDRLIWTTWRPMAVLLGLVLFLAGAAWWMAVTLFLVVYNAMHLAVRYIGLRVGASAGLEVGKILRDVPVQPVIERTSQLACLLVGVGLVLAAAPLFRELGGALVALVAISLGFWLGPRMRRTLISVIAGVAVFSILLGFAGYGA